MSNHGPATKLAGPSTSGERRVCLVSSPSWCRSRTAAPCSAAVCALLVQDADCLFEASDVTPHTCTLSTTTRTEQGHQTCTSEDSCKTRRRAKQVKKSTYSQGPPPPPPPHHRGPKQSMPTDRREAIKIDRRQEFAPDVSQASATLCLPVCCATR